MRKCYIYSIRNKKNNKRYVGSSSNILRRFRTHFQLLRDDKHPNIRLQRAYNKYGREEFVWEILEEFDFLSKEDMFAKEQKFMDLYKSYISGYNCAKNANFNGGMQEWTNEKKKSMGEKVSTALKGKSPKNLADMRKSRWRPIEELENGNVVKEYESTGQAGRELGIDYRMIFNVLKGTVKKLRDFPDKTWRYKNV